MFSSRSGSSLAAHPRYRPDGRHADPDWPGGCCCGGSIRIRQGCLRSIKSSAKASAGSVCSCSPSAPDLRPARWPMDHAWVFATFFAAIAALALPFLLGFAAVQSGALDWALARPPGTSPLLAAMAIGLCLAVSALPVLVGIVRELPQADRLLGNMALRIAALDDAILWIGLAVLLSLHAGQTSGLMQVDWAHVGAVGAFVMLAIARGPLNRVAGAHAALALGVGTLYLVVGAWATSTLGLHELLGAYFAGALAPERGRGALQARNDRQGRVIRPRTPLLRAPRP